MKVVLFHYSSSKTIEGSILDIRNDCFTIKLELGNMSEKIRVGDPLVIIYRTDMISHQLKGCYAVEVQASNGVIAVKLDMDFIIPNQRLYDRLPVSIRADIKDVMKSKRYGGVIKDISKNGLLLYCNGKMELNSRVDINIFYENVIIFVKAEVVRIHDNPHFDCYGLNIPLDDLLSSKNLHKCLKKVCESYMKKFIEDFDAVESFDKYESPNEVSGRNVEQLLNKSIVKLNEILKQLR